MQNQYDKHAISLGHKAIFGRGISLQEMIDIVSKYPAFQWLDLAAKIEGFLIIKRDDILNAQIFLTQELFPPSTLQRLNGSSAEHALCFSAGQLNFFRKLAIAYGQDDRGEVEIPIPKTGISKVFLGAQDAHDSYDRLEDNDLEIFCKFAIRNGYLNGLTDFVNSFFRAGKMCTEYAKNVPFTASEGFSDFFHRVVGITTAEAMALSFALANPFFQKKEQLLWQTTILNPQTFFNELKIDPKAIRSILDAMTVDFNDIKNHISTEFTQDPKTTPIGYDLKLFRRTPFIRLNSGKIVCVNISCLLEKSTQNIFWLPKNQSQNLTKEESDKLVIQLTSYRGVLFGEYVKELCQIIDYKNKDISFFYIPPESTHDHEEVGDSVLLLGDELIIIEAKSRQFNEKFKTTGDWQYDTNFEEELISKATQQIQVAANKIRAGKIKNIPLPPGGIRRIYPVVITYESVPMHAKIQRLVRQRVKALGHLTEDIYAPLEVIDISEMESLLDCANSLTIFQLLREKNSKDIHASETNLNNFFANYLGTHSIICNGWQSGQWTEFCKKVINPNLTFK